MRQLWAVACSMPIEKKNVHKHFRSTGPLSDVRLWYVLQATLVPRTTIFFARRHIHLQMAVSITRIHTCNHFSISTHLCWKRKGDDRHPTTTSTTSSRVSVKIKEENLNETTDGCSESSSCLRKGAKKLLAWDPSVHFLNLLNPF